jgi:hypothetical protein
MVEQRRDGRDLFAALLELMAALRAETAKDVTSADERETLREAHMRQTIRRAEREGDGWKASEKSSSVHAPGVRRAGVPDRLARPRLLMCPAF